MSDDGILGILGTILGAILGFTLSKISDIITAKRERRRYQNLLRFKFSSIKVKIDCITEHVNRVDKITDQKSLTAIQNFILGNDIKEEITKLESIADKFVISNYDENDSEYFNRLARLKGNLNFLINLSRIHNDDPQDEKPLLIELLTSISQDIVYLSQDK